MTFVLAGLVFSLVNMVVKLIVAVLAIPLIILTLGIAYFLVNVLMVFLTSWVVDDFHVDGFWAGVGAAVVVWAVNPLLGAARAAAWPRTDARGTAATAPEARRGRGRDRRGLGAASRSAASELSRESRLSACSSSSRARGELGRGADLVDDVDRLVG